MCVSAWSIPETDGLLLVVHQSIHCSMECRMIEAQASEKKSAIDEQIAVQQNALQQMKGR